MVVVVVVLVVVVVVAAAAAAMAVVVIGRALVTDRGDRDRDRGHRGLVPLLPGRLLGSGTSDRVSWCAGEDLR